MNAPPNVVGRPTLRRDLQIIADMIEPHVRVLDVGCGDGQLLYYLAAERDVDGRGMELKQSGVNACVAHGLSVVQGDADRDLADYPSDAFDYVILSLTLQATHNPRAVLAEMLRIGRRAVISFPNFGTWQVRLDLLLNGRMPRTPVLPDAWYETPNIHLCTIRDFVVLCSEMNVLIERSVALGPGGEPRAYLNSLTVANLAARQAVFLLRKGPGFKPPADYGGSA